MDSNASSPRFFCYQCNMAVHSEAQDFKCPRCLQGFIEQIEDRSEINIENTSNANILHNFDDSEPPEVPPRPPPLTGQYTDVGIDEMDEPPPPTNPQVSMNNDLAFLMSGDRVRRLRSPESLLQHLMWQITGGRVGGQPLLLLNSDPSDYVMSSEGIDAIMSQLLWHSDNDGPPPLAQDIIDRLPEIIINKEQVASNLQCSVCWDLYNLEEKVRQLKCGHIYHKDCIFPWLALHATCPICRQSLSPPEGSEPEQRNGTPRDSTNNGQNIRVPPPANITALLLRACGNPPPPPPRPDAPVSTASAPATPSSSRIIFSPAPGDAAPNTATSENSNADGTQIRSEATTENPTPNQTNANTNPTAPRRITAALSPGINHFVLMSSTPNFDPNNYQEYLALWSSTPISSTTVSSTTSDSRRSPANFDMDLE